MTQSTKCSPHKHEDLSFSPQHLWIKLDAGACKYGFCPGELEMGGSPRLAGQLLYWVQCETTVEVPLLKETETVSTSLPEVPMTNKVLSPLKFTLGNKGVY